MCFQTLFIMQPLTIGKVTKSRISTKEASDKTIRRHIQEISRREVISRGEGLFQMQEDMDWGGEKETAEGHSFHCGGTNT